MPHFANNSLSQQMPSSHKGRDPLLQWNDLFPPLNLHNYPNHTPMNNNSTPVDVVNSPPHYKKGSVECIDAIQAALTPEEFRGYCKGNALKYVWRERWKDGVESLDKANWYLKRLTNAR